MKTPGTDALLSIGDYCNAPGYVRRLFQHARTLERDCDALRTSLERILDITQHEPLGNLGNALADIARAALALAKGGEMSATPETDTMVDRLIPTQYLPQELIDKSRQLERQRDSLKAHNATMIKALETALATIGSLAPDYPPVDYVAKNESIIRAALARANGKV